MAKNRTANPQEIELHPDAWDRFRQAVHIMAKAVPQHRISGGDVKSEHKRAGDKSPKKVKPPVSHPKV